MLQKRVRSVLGVEAGAFDLPSILVGVVVVGVLVAGVLASIFGVIPFAQDNGAKQDLDSIRTAQGTMKAKDGAFGNRAALAGSGYIALPASAVVDSDGSVFCASVTSQTGQKFRITSENNNAQKGSCTKVTTWTKSSLPDGNWIGSAVSQDSRTLLVVGEWNAKLSTDGGATWTNAPIGASARWRAAGMSADGKTMVVGGEYTSLYVSKDSGKTWSANASSQLWMNARVSNDGSVVAATGQDAPEFSVDGGKTFTSAPVSGTWWDGAWVSGNGGRIMMAANGVLAVSADRGATWASRPSATSGGTGAYLAASDDGKVIANGSDYGTFNLSRDSGATWTSTPAGATLAVWISPDGKMIVKGPGASNRPEISRDGGLTWTQQDAVGSAPWRVSVNGDGSAMIAAGYGGPVWVGHDGYEQ